MRLYTKGPLLACTLVWSMAVYAVRYGDAALAFAARSTLGGACSRLTVLYLNTTFNTGWAQISWPEDASRCEAVVLRPTYVLDLAHLLLDRGGLVR